MGRHFLDSSALVKRYHQESGSADVQALLDDPDNQVIISRLALVELHSTFARLVREGVLSKKDFETVIARLEGDIATGILNVMALSSQRLDAACSLLATTRCAHLMLFISPRPRRFMPAAGFWRSWRPTRSCWPLPLHAVFQFSMLDNFAAISQEHVSEAVNSCLLDRQFRS